jgi:dipeptidyl aminopeptidase/acylaminoacyl peptidase
VSRVGGWEEPADEEEREQSKPPRIIDVLKCKSNGVGFIYDRPQQIFVVSPDGGPVRHLTVGPFDSHHPAWAPDGQRVAFVSARHAERDEDGAADVFTVPVGGGDACQLTRTEGPVSWPVFSPAGRTVAYVAGLPLDAAPSGVPVPTPRRRGASGPSVRFGRRTPGRRRQPAPPVACEPDARVVRVEIAVP